MTALALGLNIKTDYLTEYLVAKLEEHKEQHILEYKEAYEEFERVRSERIRSLQTAVNDLTNNPDSDLNELSKKYNSLLTLAKPVNATKMYEQYISLLKASATDRINLEISDANAIINDEWSWAKSARTTNAFYSATSASKL